MYVAGNERGRRLTKILLVEDDAVTRDYVLAGLNGAGHITDATADGVEGLAMALRGSYDAIVLDRMLPTMDGLAVLKALRAAASTTPVLFLTAIGGVDDRVEGLEAGADDYLVKPFAFSELAARLAAGIPLADRHQVGVRIAEAASGGRIGGLSAPPPPLTTHPADHDHSTMG